MKMVETQRIVSFLPSATEMICALGLGDRLLGVTHECDYPPAVDDLPKITRDVLEPGLSANELVHPGAFRVSS